MPPRLAFAPITAPDLINLALYAVTCGAIILIIDWHRRRLSRLEREDSRRQTLTLEQQHRAQNAVVVAEAMVRDSLPDDLVRARIISQRIRAAFADVDIHLRTRPIRLLSLLTHELEPFDLARFAFEGEDDAMLPPQTSSIVTLAAHELATNALKYGALSVPEGRVSVAWRMDGERLTIRWRETRGPLVERPRARGYGSVMLGRLVKAAGGAIDIDFPPTGATARISLPVERRRRERLLPNPRTQAVTDAPSGLIA
jgi:two-component sensor histidine kinase